MSFADEDFDQDEQEESGGQDERSSQTNPSHNNRSQSQGGGLGQKAKDKAEDEAKKKLEHAAETKALKQGGKQAGKQLAKRGAQAALVAGAGASGGTSLAIAAAIEAADQAQQFLRNPEKTARKWLKWIIYAVVLFIILLTLFFMLFMVILAALVGINDASSGHCESGQSTIDVKISGPDTAKNGDRLEYKFEPDNSGGFKEIRLTDRIPEGADFESADRGGNYDSKARTVTWSLKDAGSVTLALKVTQDNVYLTSRPTACGVKNDTNTGGGGGGNSGGGNSGGGAPTTGGNIEPSTDDCGKADYKKSMAMLPGDKAGKNYGDPKCTFSKEELTKFLQEKDSANAEKWFCLAQPESEYNPNAFLGSSTSGAGAYGLYQMNPPGPTQKNSNDNGYVVWTLQVENAIKLRATSGDWTYWDARSRAQCPGL